MENIEQELDKIIEHLKTNNGKRYINHLIPKTKDAILIEEKLRLCKLLDFNQPDSFNQFPYFSMSIYNKAIIGNMLYSEYLKSEADKILREIEFKEQLFKVNQSVIDTNIATTKNFAKQTRLFWATFLVAIISTASVVVASYIQLATYREQLKQQSPEMQLLRDRQILQREYLLLQSKTSVDSLKIQEQSSLKK